LQCRDVLQCVFELNPLEIDIFRLIVREGPMSAETLGEKLGKDRSTAYRALRHLQACRIAYKKTVNLEQGGYRHIYHVVSPAEVKNEMESCLDEWYEKMRTAVRRFPEDLKASLRE